MCPCTGLAAHKGRWDKNKKGAWGTWTDKARKGRAGIKGETEERRKKYSGRIRMEDEESGLESEVWAAASATSSEQMLDLQAFNSMEPLKLRLCTPNTCIQYICLHLLENGTIYTSLYGIKSCREEGRVWRRRCWRNLWLHNGILHSL